MVIDADDTPTEQVVALPDGNFQLTENTEPVRVRTASGWVPVDTSLTRASDGFLVPTATDYPVEFSSGGTSVLAKDQTSAGDWIQVSSPFGVLPTPTVAGATATYANVLPGVDLIMTATADGMSEVLEIESASAAANQALQAVDFGVSGGDVTSDDGGVATATATDGSSVESASPNWWDSSDGSTAAGPVGDNSQTPVVSSVDGSSVALDAAAAVTSRAVTYPVFVDPDWTGAVQHFTYIDEAYPNQAYYDGEDAGGQQRVGYIEAADSPDNLNHLARAFWQLDTSGVEGDTILAAQFSVTEDWSYNCTASPVELWQTRGFNSSTTWNNPPLLFVTLQDTQTVAYGASGSCPTHTVGFDASNAVTTAAGGDASGITLGLKASNESSDSGWKRFDQSASLVITYDTPPNTATSLSIATPSRACSTSSSSPVYVNGTQAIILQATITDPDVGQNVDATFKVWKPGASSSTYSSTTALQAQGNETWSIPANGLTNGQLYYWNVRSGDGTDTSDLSGDCYFQIDNTAPPLPTIASMGTATTVGVGVTVKFASNLGDNVVAFAYWWTDGAPASPGPAAPSSLVSISTALPADGAASGGVRYASASPTTGDSATLTVAPIDLSSTLNVASFDAAGNESKAGSNSSYGTSVTALRSSTVDYAHGHEWVLDQLSSPLSSTVADSNTTSGSSLTSEADLSLGSTVNKSATDEFYSDGYYYTPVFGFTASGQIVRTSRQVIDTTQSFTVTGFINLTDRSSVSAMAQAGTGSSGFSLQTDSSGKWQFCVRPQVSGGSTNCATAPSAAPLSTWLEVTGIWDAENQQVRLLIGDSFAITAVGPHTLPPGDHSSTGDFLVGSDSSSGVTERQLIGEIDDPAIFPGVIDSTQLENLGGFLPVN
ncbi:MAG TPA: hypothetical protein VHX87_04595 [Galbitalea sp.]|nr:hypothetical protein [Galbitalea sp.]